MGSCNMTCHPPVLLQASIADGIGSRKMRVLADSAVTLARCYPEIVAADVVKRMLKVSKSVNVQLHPVIVSP